MTVTRWLKTAAGILLVVALLSCSKEQTWTDAEKENARYIFAAFKEAQEAIQSSNAGSGKMSLADF